MPRFTLEQLNSRIGGTWSGMLGMRFTEISERSLTGEFIVTPAQHAANGYLHAGAVVTFADTVCGFGTIAHLPDGATGFTTIELKSNFLGTALEGTLTCTGVMVHSGRSTQVWDATVLNSGSGQALALFRCTQMILYPRK